MSRSDKRGNLARERLRGRGRLLERTLSVFASQIHLPREGEVLLYLPEDAKKLPLRGKTSPAPGEDVTVGDKKGNLAANAVSRLRGFAPLLHPFRFVY